MRLLKIEELCCLLHCVPYALVCMFLDSENFLFFLFFLFFKNDDDVITKWVHFNTGVGVECNQQRSHAGQQSTTGVYGLLILRCYVLLLALAQVSKLNFLESCVSMLGGLSPADITRLLRMPPAGLPTTQVRTVSEAVLSQSFCSRCCLCMTGYPMLQLQFQVVTIGVACVNTLNICMVAEPASLLLGF
jgi:hypothetical protein